MRAPFFYAGPLVARRWAEGEHFPGLYFCRPSGRCRCVLPTGRRVTSVYGKARR